MTIARKLRHGLAELGQTLPGGAEKKLLRFLELLQRWNRTINLTAVREIDDMVAAHLLDSLAIRPWLAGDRILDVGSGAGLPGIPLAIAEPQRSFILLDSAAKRCRFLTQAVVELGLANVRVENRRVEDYLVSSDEVPPFSTITARAFSSLDKLTAAAGHLLADRGSLLAMKGKMPQGELNMLPDGWRLQRAEKLVIPELAAERHLLILERVKIKDPERTWHES